MLHKRLPFLLVLSILLMAVLGVQAQEDEPFDNLHVPSPDWSQQIIYFLLTDRFNDGDPSNNDQGAGVYDPSDPSHYSGGDLQGIIDEIEYIKGLGATAIWITPPVANQWWDPVVNYGGYHGYWAENFLEVDAHYGTLETYKALSQALHDQDMYLIQDIVTNHTGNFFSYVDEDGEEAWNPDNLAEFYTPNEGSIPVTEPSQPPFDLNNATNPEELAAGIYNFSPVISDFNDEFEVTQYQLSDLDDINTANPVVREALRETYAYWIEEVGVDGFRVDTVKHVEHEFWNDFFHSTDPDIPGILSVAAGTGRDDFLAFGEIFDGRDDFVASYLGTEDQPELPSVLNFPMHYTINEVFADGVPTSAMTQRLQVAVDPDVYGDPTTTPLFIDNHDVARFLARGNEAGFKQALMFMMNIPGIPIIYYGSEQGFVERRSAMFAEGYLSGGEDRFDTESELYTWIAELSERRKSNPLFTRGDTVMLADDNEGPGIFAFKRTLDDESAIVLFNTNDRPILVNTFDPQLPPGTVLEVAQSVVNTDNLVVGADGTMTLALAGREGMVLMVTDEVIATDGVDANITVDTPIAGETFTEDVTIEGSATVPNTPLQLVINGNLAFAVDFAADDAGNFSVVMPLNGFLPGVSENTVTIYAPELNITSETFTFIAEVTGGGATVLKYDWIGDAIGPNGNITLPTDETFGDQMDILSTQVAASGSNLEVTLTMAEITDVWNPANGFDHVLFHIYLDLPGQEGLSVLPRINAEAPEGFAWDYFGWLDGWNQRTYSTEGASADEYGTSINPAPEIETDMDAGTIKVLFPAESLGNPETLEGTKVYVTTWDWDGVSGAYRPLVPAGGEQWAFGGGDPDVDPFILDDTDVITLGADTRFIQSDPAGDASGPSGTYLLPTDETFGDQMDLIEASMIPTGSNLQVEVQMAEITDVWNPANGFDHVLFHIYIDLPGQEGLTVLPRINADAPEGFAWDYFGWIDGWNQRVYSTEGASADEYGTSINPAPEIETDMEAGSIRFLFAAESLGNPETLEGTRVYITTWDWDGVSGAYRPLGSVASQWGFGGGESGDPLILDDIFIGEAAEYVPPEPEIPIIDVTFTLTSVPDNTPEDATFYIVGAFNNNDPGDMALEDQGDGTYSITLPFEEGSLAQYRITRGSFANAEVIDPDSRVAQRELLVSSDNTNVEIEITGWWDD